MASFTEQLLAASEDESLSPADLRAWMRRAALRLGKGKGKKPARELAARALCRMDGHPENTKFEGKPMWRSYLAEADALMAALFEDAEAEGRASERR